MSTTKDISPETSAAEAQQTPESGPESGDQQHSSTSTMPTSSMTDSQAPDEPALESESSIPPSVSQPPSLICLAPCHRFHTNPAVSSPKHFLQSTARSLSLGASPGRSNTHSSSLSANNNKALKRKQRLAQYKAQVTSSDHPAFSPAIASIPTQGGLSTAAEKALTSSSSGGGDACPRRFPLGGLPLGAVGRNARARQRFPA